MSVSARAVRSALLLLLLVGLVRAAGHFVRLAMLAAMGLAGMYMLHMLAQDYNKIQSHRPKPAAAAGKALLRAVFKRDVGHVADQFLDFENALDTASLDWVLEHDPKGCARKMVCELATKSPSKIKEDEAAILRFIKHDISAAADGSVDVGGVGEFRKAFELGRASRDPEECAATYTKCEFQARTVLKMMRAHS